MTTPQLPLPPNAPKNRQTDAVLDELWAVKRAINAEAKFDAKVIAKLANAQRLEDLLRKKSH
jgi:hypothetical protein